ncbi:unnamed protein product [Gongylonema pulchrum]|uniref:Uncharacterized protein n=1 Tax=Gongylonema pulchrum TaxID=637853 RepID=A0A3P7NN02_9BILA|nr:unnamed protein product [Gongylonema pulchrum]
MNVIEAYRNRVGEATPYHHDDDFLSIEVMAYPMPFITTFGPGGLYIDQRVHLEGFFSCNLTAIFSTPSSSFVFKLEYEKRKKDKNQRVHLEGFFSCNLTAIFSTPSSSFVFKLEYEKRKKDKSCSKRGKEGIERRSEVDKDVLKNFGKV